MARGNEIVRSKGKQRVFDNNSDYEDHYDILDVADRAMQEFLFDEERRADDRTIKDLHKKLGEALAEKKQVVHQSGIWSQRFHEL